MSTKPLHVDGPADSTDCLATSGNSSRPPQSPPFRHSAACLSTTCFGGCGGWQGEAADAAPREMLLLAQHRGERKLYLASFPSGGVPWSLLEPHREQAQKNHGQTLERLSERGGLGPDEMLAIIEGRRWHHMDEFSALAQLKALCAPTQPDPDAAVRVPTQGDYQLAFSIKPTYVAAPSVDDIARAIAAGRALGRDEGARELRERADQYVKSRYAVEADWRKRGLDATAAMLHADESERMLKALWGADAIVRRGKESK